MDENSPYRQQVVLVRHGETEWALQGRHTGRTDVRLTERGRQQAVSLGRFLRRRQFANVLVSPLQRALETCRLAGLGEVAEIRDDLAEWDYGDYEGRTTEDILAERPGWTLWDDGVPGGEAVEGVGRRADRVIAEIRSTPGDVAVFAHGHILRILAARWVYLVPKDGRRFALDPAGVSVLGYEHTWPVLAHWNETLINADEEDHHDIAAAF
jgi:broad specificity phosphatase PhoE